MLDKLVDILDVKDKLGYDDMRTVRKWCKDNRIPLLVFGKKTYTVSILVDRLLEDELQPFIEANYDNPEDVMDAIRNDDQVQLDDSIAAIGVEEDVPMTEANSEASKQFLNNIKD